MARVTLIAAISLDGSWITPKLSFPIWKCLLLPRPNQEKTPLFTDLPPFQDQSKGIQWRRLDDLIQLSSEKRPSQKPFRVLGSPQLHRALIENGSANQILLLWSPQIELSPQRLPFVAPFLPPNGRRISLRWRVSRKTPHGLLSHYQIASAVRR